MTAFTKSEENYISHEVQLRVNDEKFKLQDQKFQSLEKSIKHLDDKIDASIKHLDNKLDSSIKHLGGKLDWMLGIFISTGIIACLVPVALHFMKVS